MDWCTSVLYYHSLIFITDLLSRSVNGKPLNTEIIVVHLYTINIGRFIMFSVITNIYNENQRTYLNGIIHSHSKTEKVFFLTTRDVRWVHHGWHGTHRYSIQVFATHVSTCVAKTWISYHCVPCHPWCTHRTSLVVKKTFFSFPVAVNNFIKVGPLVFLL